MLSVVQSDRNWNKSKMIIIMHSLVICNFKKDLINNNQEKWIYRFLNIPGQLTLQSVVESGRKLKIIQASMVVLVTCKNKDPFELKALEWSQNFSNCKSMDNFSEAQEQLTPQSVFGFGQNVCPDETL